MTETDDRVRSLLVFDGNNIAMRCLKAAEARVPLTNEEGTWTAPVYMAINMLSKYVRRYPSESVVVAWDKGHAARDLVYDGYKEARSAHDPASEDPKTGVFGMLKMFLSLAGVHHVEVAGFEADDIIGAYWRMSWIKMVIVSGDKDLLQLVTHDVLQVRPGGPTTNQEAEEWNDDRVLEKMGCIPRHIPSVMALTGDSGDSIPGIPGYGNITACRALAAVNWNLDALLNNPPQRLAKVEGYREIVERNLKLVDLRNVKLAMEPPAPFDPTTPAHAAWSELMLWCDSNQMASVKARLLDDKLWRD